MAKHTERVICRALPNAVKNKLYHQHLDCKQEEKHSEQLGEESLRHEEQLSAHSGQPVFRLKRSQHK